MQLFFFILNNFKVLMFHKINKIEKNLDKTAEHLRLGFFFNLEKTIISVNCFTILIG